MKKNLFLFLIFTGLVFGQEYASLHPVADLGLEIKIPVADFTIRSQPAHGALLDTDIWLMSNAAGSLTKLSWLANLQALDDEAFVWTANHDFNATTSITGGTFYIQNVKTATTLGEFATTSSGVYLKYKGTQEDTIATRRHIWQDDFDIYGDWTFKTEVTLQGANLVWSGSGYFIIPSDHSTSIAGSLHRLSGGDRVNLLMTHDASGGRDTMVTFYELLLKDRIIYGDWTFNDVLGANVTGTISYAPGTDIVPVAAWNVSGLPQVVIVSVQTSVTVTSMTGAVDGQVLMIVNGDEQGDYVTIQDNSSINLRGGRDFIFNDQWQSLTLVYTEQNTNEWTEIGRSHKTTSDFNGIDVGGIATFADVTHQGGEYVAPASSSVTLSGNTNVYFIDPVDPGYTVTSFAVTDVEDGDRITLIGAGEFSLVFSDASPFYLSGEFTLNEFDTLELVYYNTKFYEVSRSNN